MRLGLIIVWLFFSLIAYGQNSESSSLVGQARQHYLKGKEYAAQGDYEKANEEFKKAEELLKKSPQAKVVKDRPSKKVKDQPALDRAKVFPRISKRISREDYLELLKHMPDNPDVHYNLAVYYLINSNYWDAVQELNQVIRLNPGCN